MTIDVILSRHGYLKITGRYFRPCRRFHSIQYYYWPALIYFIDIRNNAASFLLEC